MIRNLRFNMKTDILQDFHICIGDLNVVAKTADLLQNHRNTIYVISYLSCALIL